MFIAAICARYLDLCRSVWHSRVVKQRAYGYCICIWINVSFITHILWDSCFGCSANNCRNDLSSLSPSPSSSFFIFTSVEICFWLDCPRDLLESHNFFLPTVYISLTINIVPSFKLPYIFYWLGTNTFVWSDWFHIYWKCLVFARRLLIACCSYS